MQPATLQLLPDPVGHVETGCLQGLDEDGAQEDSGLSDRGDGDLLVLIKDEHKDYVNGYDD